MRHYSYAVNGNLATIADSRHGQRSYYYDALNRLTRVRHTRDEPPESFAHDPAGDLLMQDRPGPTTVKGNRLLMQGDRHYDYDAFGNLIRERRGTGQKLVTEYRYNCQHRLVGVTLPDGSCTNYRYDAFGRRIAKIVDGKTTEFFWQGDQVVAESSREHYRSYIYEPGTFRPLAMLDGKGPRKACPFYYQLDHLGTPQELTDFGGEIVWSAKYNAYGKVTRLAFGGGEQLDQPLRFQGQYFDVESGLHYNRHRYYDPEVGRYLTTDPIKLAGGLNQYQYTPNPTGWVDPLGLSGNCPPPNKSGCKAPDDTTGVKVDDGEPAQPNAYTHFPEDPNELTEALGVQPKVSQTQHGSQRMAWRPNADTIIRFESHPGDAGEFNARHHGEHYHLELKPSHLSWSQADKKKAIVKVKPDGYQLGHGTGFVAGEKHPGTSK
jgi:RHS repeat-associated protein